VNQKKRLFIDDLLRKLQTELVTMRRAADDARSAATHEEAKPENDKDTRALEASYLAGAQAARVRDLEGAIKAIGQLDLLDLSHAGSAIQSSAVVVLEDEDGARTTFFLAPVGGGTTVSDGVTSAQVVTPQSPLGRMLLGRTKGDVIEMRGKAGLREMTILEVR
jgi:transcription elongation GreA/GreB family factor